MGVLMQGEVAKEKVYSYFKRPEVGITVSASALMYMDCIHAVMLKPASVHIKKYFECFCK